ncbi:ABC-type Fe3+-hydroxamate transport system, periplasmic component [Bellilinea caldifistulae]|nr:helical backbone metal receptor [Bellilinea caldifistulae]GAP10670.1 ABC-type Fe3+-hydroxamate transport system, periplasmic component [Bellilinea caldifistulae]
MPILRDLSSFSTFPKRVVSLVPSMTESLFDLGMGDFVVGVTDYCVFPPEVKKLPRVGGTKNIQVDHVAQLSPELIIANQEENSRVIVEELADQFAVWLTFPKTVRQMLDDLWQLVYLFRQERSFISLRTLETAVEYAENRVFDLQPLRVFVPIWQDITTSQIRWWMTFNQDTYCHDLIRLLGGTNVFGERLRKYPLAADLGESEETTGEDRDTRYPRVIAEEIIRAEPELILIPDEPYPFREEDIEELQKILASTPAVKQNRVYRIEGSLLTWHGTRLGKALAELSQYFNSD